MFKVNKIYAVKKLEKILLHFGIFHYSKYRQTQEDPHLNVLISYTIDRLMSFPTR
jgi:hypothetical protein